ncbi:MAG: tRNA (N6-threonylcarbamoyladenosine(37)-N6)-methyltransferase TrmO [Pyrobaculum sp.]
MACFEPIGYVRHGYSDEEVKRRRFVDGFIEVLPQYAEGLRGLEEFSHVVVLAYLHKHRGRPLLVRPKRVENAPEVGVFATDSPDRPNPIALTVVRLLRVEGARLYVDGLDLFDGTPVLDLKGFSPRRCPADARAPWWAD